MNTKKGIFVICPQEFFTTDDGIAIVIGVQQSLFLFWGFSQRDLELFEGEKKPVLFRRLQLLLQLL